MIITLMNDFLLQLRNPLCLDFHTEVSSCQHNSVGSLYNRINIVECFLRLNFGNNLHLGTGFINNGPNLSYRICGTNEGSRHKVKVLRDTELDVLNILVGNGRKLNGYTGYIHTLSLSKLSPVCYLT